MRKEANGYLAGGSSVKGKRIVLVPEIILEKQKHSQFSNCVSYLCYFECRKLAYSDTVSQPLAGRSEEGRPGDSPD